MTRRRVWSALAAVAMAPLLWLVGVGALAYRRAPGLVGDLERSGGLPLRPESLAPARVCALLSVQDRAFFRHQGIGLFDGPIGHTTLTQSVCKGLFFDGLSPGVLRHRKAMLMADAWAFDRLVPKQMQLRIFLNRAYFGIVDGKEIHGFASAAASFFGKDIQSVSDREYLALVAMLAAPNTYHVLRRPEENAARVRGIERLLQSTCPAECLAVPPYAPCKTSAS